MSKGVETAAGIGALVYIGLIITILIGWVMNIVDLVHMSFDPMTGEAIVRIIGVFLVPVGAFMGIFF